MTKEQHYHIKLVFADKTEKQVSRPNRTLGMVLFTKACESIDKGTDNLVKAEFYFDDQLILTHSNSQTS